MCKFTAGMASGRCGQTIPVLDWGFEGVDFVLCSDGHGMAGPGVRWFAASVFLKKFGFLDSYRVSVILSGIR